MRWRLIISFGLVILISITSVVWVIRQSAVEEVHTFMFRGGMLGLNGLVIDLEECYQEHRSWEICSSVLDTHSRRRGNMPKGRGGIMGNRPLASAENQHLQLLSRDGTVIADTAGETDQTSIDPDMLQSAIPLRTGEEIMGYLLPEGRPTFTQQQESDLISRLNRAALTSVVVAGAAALILATYLTYQLLLPIRKLTHAAEGLKDGDLSQRVDVKGNTELASLGRVFNQMARALETTAERRKNLTADIAHELRTPLSVQQAHLEALQDGIYELNQENLQIVQEQNKSLIRLVDDLRTLSMADAGELNLERTWTDSAQFITKTIDQFKPKMQQKGISIHVIVPDIPPQIYVDPQRIEQIITNLLSNALHHAPQGSQIDVELSVSKAQVAIMIRDRGEGIPEKDLPYLFQRFYKSDKTRQEGEGGTGLGLSISQKLAQAHGGRVTAENHPEGGAIFTLHLPREEPKKGNQDV